MSVSSEQRSDTLVAIKVDQPSSTIIYVGEAAIASLASEAVWRIKKIDTTSGVIITWADGDSQFDNVWNDRTTITYT